MIKVQDLYLDNLLMIIVIKVRPWWLGAVLQYSGKLVVFLMSLNIIMIIKHH